MGEIADSLMSSGNNVNTVLSAVRAIIEEDSNKAVSRGNEFKGFLGFSPDQYSKEDLILLLNVLFDEIESLRLELSEYAKRFIV